MKDLLEKISALRKEKGFTQKDMAERLGIASINYSKLERGETQLTIDKLTKISHALELDSWVHLIPNVSTYDRIENLKSSKREMLLTMFREFLSNVGVLNTWANSEDVSEDVRNIFKKQLSNSIEGFSIEMSRLLSEKVITIQDIEYIKSFYPSLMLKYPYKILIDKLSNI